MPRLNCILLGDTVRKVHRIALSPAQLGADYHALLAPFPSCQRLRGNESRSCDKFDWYKVPRPIHLEWYKYLSGVCISVYMSMTPTGFEISEAKDIIRLENELDRE